MTGVKVTFTTSLRKSLNSSEITRIINDAFYEVVTDFTQEAQNLTTGWQYKNRPRIKRKRKVSSTSIQDTVTLEGEVFTYVEEGTKPHDIPKVPFVGKHSLRYVSNGEVFYRKKVHHPGTAPQRLFADLVEEWRPVISSHVRNKIAQKL